MNVNGLIKDNEYLKEKFTIHSDSISEKNDKKMNNILSISSKEDNEIEKNDKLKLEKLEVLNEMNSKDETIEEKLNKIEKSSINNQDSEHFINQFEDSDQIVRNDFLKDKLNDEIFENDIALNYRSLSKNIKSELENNVLDLKISNSNKSSKNMSKFNNKSKKNSSHNVSTFKTSKNISPYSSKISPNKHHNNNTENLKFKSVSKLKLIEIEDFKHHDLSTSKNNIKDDYQNNSKVKRNYTTNSVLSPFKKQLQSQNSNNKNEIKIKGLSSYNFNTNGSRIDEKNDSVEEDKDCIDEFSEIKEDCFVKRYKSSKEKELNQNRKNSELIIERKPTINNLVYSPNVKTLSSLNLNTNPIITTEFYNSECDNTTNINTKKFRNENITERFSNSRINKTLKNSTNKIRSNTTNKYDYNKDIIQKYLEITKKPIIRKLKPDNAIVKNYNLIKQKNDEVKLKKNYNSKIVNKYENYDETNLISKALEEITLKPPKKSDCFLKRLNDDIAGRKIKKCKIDEYVSNKKPKIPMTNQLNTFNRLISDANRRISTQRTKDEKLEDLEKANNLFNKSVDHETWNSIYNDRFLINIVKKNRVIEIIKNKQIEEQKEEENKYLEYVKLKHKSIPKKELNTCINRLYNEASRKKLEIEKKIELKRQKEIDYENSFLTHKIQTTIYKPIKTENTIDRSSIINKINNNNKESDINNQDCLIEDVPLKDFNLKHENNENFLELTTIKKQEYSKNKNNVNKNIEKSTKMVKNNQKLIQIKQNKDSNKLELRKEINVSSKYDNNNNYKRQKENLTQKNDKSRKVDENNDIKSKVKKSVNNTKSNKKIIYTDFQAFKFIDKVILNK